MMFCVFWKVWLGNWDETYHGSGNLDKTYHGSGNWDEWILKVVETVAHHSMSWTTHIRRYFPLLLHSKYFLFFYWNAVTSSELFKRAICTMVHFCLSFLLILKVLWREPFSLVLYSTQWGNSGLLPLCFSRKRYRDCSVKKLNFFLTIRKAKVGQRYGKIWAGSVWEIYHQTVT